MERRRNRANQKGAAKDLISFASDIKPMGNNWYVVTGGPNSGKTTLINKLASMGYLTSQEYSRFFIDRELKKGRVLDEIRKDSLKFQNDIIKVKLKLEHDAQKDKTVFFDRGLPDSIAYYKVLKIQMPKGLIELCRNRYRKIFLLDMLPYRQDYARNESKKQAYRIHRTIRKVYEMLGYRIVRVPVISVEERARMVIENLAKDQPKS